MAGGTRDAADAAEGGIPGRAEVAVDADVTTLVETELPVGATEALNFFGDIAYAGPCPAPGETNTYRLTVHALNQQLELADGTPAREMLDAIESVSLGATSVTGTRTR